MQEGVYAVLTDLRAAGALTTEALLVLESIDDYMSCVEASISNQIVACDATLGAALEAIA